MKDPTAPATANPVRAEIGNAIANTAIGMTWSNQPTSTIIVSATARKKRTSSWRRSERIRVIANAKNRVNTTIGRISSSAAALNGFAGTRLMIHSVKDGTSVTPWAATLAAPTTLP